MKYPTLRYGNPTEFAYYVQGLPLNLVAKRLRRSERSIRNWLTGAEKMPWWIPELLRLQDAERWQRMQQMTHSKVNRQDGLLEATLLQFPTATTRRRPLAVNDAYYHGEPPPMRAVA